MIDRTRPHSTFLLQINLLLPFQASKFIERKFIYRSDNSCAASSFCAEFWSVDAFSSSNFCRDLLVFKVKVSVAKSPIFACFTNHCSFIKSAPNRFNVFRRPSPLAETRKECNAEYAPNQRPSYVHPARICFWKLSYPLNSHVMFWKRKCQHLELTKR